MYILLYIFTACHFNKIFELNLNCNIDYIVQPNCLLSLTITKAPNNVPTHDTHI